MAEKNIQPTNNSTDLLTEFLGHSFLLDDLLEIQSVLNEALTKDENSKNGKTTLTVASDLLEAMISALMEKADNCFNLLISDLRKATDDAEEDVD